MIYDGAIVRSATFINEIDSSLIIKIFTNMVRTRCFNEKINELINRGYLIDQRSYLGQEVAPITACTILNESDVVMPSHRGWGWAISKGMQPKYMLAELLGKETGYCKGKGGASLGSYQHLILGRHGIQGSQINLATGVGLTLKKRNQGEVCICIFDKSTSTGCFHESLIMAATWKIPVIFIVENNFSEDPMGIETISPYVDIRKKVIEHDTLHQIIDGNHPMTVYKSVSQAIERARVGGGPSLIETKIRSLLNPAEMNTLYNGNFRSKEDVDIWKEKPPIKQLEDKLINSNISPEEKLEFIKIEAIEEMEIAEKYAIESPYPDVSSYFEDVYA